MRCWTKAKARLGCCKMSVHLSEDSLSWSQSKTLDIFGWGALALCTSLFFFLSVSLTAVNSLWIQYLLQVPGTNTGQKSWSKLVRACSLVRKTCLDKEEEIIKEDLLNLLKTNKPGMMEYTCNPRRLRQWDYELQGSLGYIERSSFSLKK